MLIRFVAKNIYSFKEETEFNLFPNKTQRLIHHKVTKNNIDVLRLSTIYGANGSGKSNLIKSISLLETMIEKGKIIDNTELADQLLPTTSGFFFGNTDYNEYYYNDIKSTIEQLTEVLDDVDFNEYHVIYQSSW